MAVNMRTCLYAGILLCFSVTVAGVGYSTPAQPIAATQEAVPAPQEHLVEIHKFKFQTKVLDVKIGDTVTWVNNDIVPHTATALDGSWDSGRLKKGERFTLTITSETSLAYYCAYHRQMKASLSIIDLD